MRNVDEIVNGFFKITGRPISTMTADEYIKFISFANAQPSMNIEIREQAPPIQAGVCNKNTTIKESNALKSDSDFSSTTCYGNADRIGNDHNVKEAVKDEQPKQIKNTEDSMKNVGNMLRMVKG